jgi:hypothetical protein
MSQTSASRRTRVETRKQKIILSQKGFSSLSAGVAGSRARQSGSCEDKVKHRMLGKRQSNALDGDREGGRDSARERALAGVE